MLRTSTSPSDFDHRLIKIIKDFQYGVLALSINLDDDHNTHGAEFIRGVSHVIFKPTQSSNFCQILFHANSLEQDFKIMNFCELSKKKYDER